MAYSGSYHPKNREKYLGDPKKITYRSLWEKKAMEWCDLNPDVVGWESEETVVPYRCKTDGAMHRYFCDLRIVFNSGATIVVEIKPEAQTRPPKKGKNQARFLSEAMTYAKNHSKWEAAREYCRKRGWVFQIWSEKTLDSLGIKTMRKPRKR